MRVGYVRCSTVEQNEARQLKMMEELKAHREQMSSQQSQSGEKYDSIQEDSSLDNQE